MNWKPNGTGLIGKEDDWAAYIRQDSVTCLWRVFKEGQVKGAGFAENIEIAKQYVDKIVEKG